jgi:hypothetical protein
MAEPRVEIHEREAYVEARYLGSYSLETYKKQMELSVRACLERKQRLLLVDITDLAGFAPTTAERHQLGVTGAELSRDLAKVAALGTPEQIEPEPLAALVARNRGLRIEAFTDGKKALEWLLKPEPR